MKTSNKLMEERGALVEELETLLDTVASAERDFSDTENERQDEIHAKIGGLDDSIQRAKNNEAVFTKKSNKAVAVDMRSSASAENEMASIAKKFSLTEGIRSLAQGRPLEGVLREMDQEARKEANESGISLRGEFNIPAALSYGKRTAYGVSSTDANITNSTNSDGMVQENALEAALSLQGKSVIAQAGATQLSGFAGDVKLPTMPGNSVVSDGGNGAANEGDAIGVGTSAFESVTLKPTRFAGAVDISKHLMYSANGQLDDLFGRDLGNAIAAKFDEHVLTEVRERLGAADRHSAGRSNAAKTAGLATDFSDVARLMGVYLGGNPDDLNRAFFMSPEIYGHLLGQTADAGGMIQAAAGEQVLGHPAFVTTNVKNASFETLEYFGDTDTNDTITASPIMCVDASDIFMCTWAGLSINVDVYTEALKGVVRVIADGYMDGNIRRSGSGALAAGLTVDTTY